MKKFARLVSVLFAIVLCLSAMCGMAAFAEDTSPVKITVKADKDAYSQGDKLRFDVSVSNENGFALDEVAVQASLSDKFEFTENEKISVKLAANETKNYTVSAKPAAKKGADSPKTGVYPPVLIIIIGGAAVILAFRTKRSRQVFSLMITAVLVGSLTFHGYGPAANAADTKEITVKAEFTYDSKKETLTLTAKYEEPVQETTTEPVTEAETSQVLDYNKQALRDVTGVSNARQLGGYVNTEGRAIKQNVLLRTGSLAHITDGGIKALQEKYKVSDIMDFRYDRELNPNTVDKEIEGINYHNIPMAPSKAKAEQVFSQDSEKFAKLQELQRNMGKPGGSIALTIFQVENGVVNANNAVEYFETDEAADYFRDAFDVFLNKPEDAAVLFHCAGGKDRTGIVSMLLLSALDFDKDVIMQDYLMTNTANAKQIEEVTAAAEEYTEDPDIRYNIIFSAAVYPELMEKNINDFTEQYGSVKGFLREKVGLTDDDFAKLKELYLED